jgi:hypothetical protein
MKRLFSNPLFFLGCIFAALLIVAICASAYGQSSCPIPNNLAIPCVFIRGDADGSESVNITDYIVIQNWLYQSGPRPVTLDGADVNDDGDVNGSDLSYLSAFLYSGGPAPPEPHPFLGNDCTDDDLELCCSEEEGLTGPGNYVEDGCWFTRGVPPHNNEWTEVYPQQWNSRYKMVRLKNYAFYPNDACDMSPTSDLVSSVGWDLANSPPLEEFSWCELESEALKLELDLYFTTTFRYGPVCEGTNCSTEYNEMIVDFSNAYVSLEMGDEEVIDLDKDDVDFPTSPGENERVVFEYWRLDITTQCLVVCNTWEKNQDFEILGIDLTSAVKNAIEEDCTDNHIQKIKIKNILFIWQIQSGYTDDISEWEQIAVFIDSELAYDWCLE